MERKHIKRPTQQAKHFYVLHHGSGIVPAIVFCKKIQFLPCLIKRHSVYTNVDAAFILTQAESKKLEVLLYEDAGYLMCLLSTR